MKFNIWPIVAMYAEVCDYFWKFLTILGAIFADKMRRQVFDLTKSIQKSYRDIIAIDLLHEAKVKEQREQVSRFFYHLFWYNSAAIYSRMLHFFNYGLVLWSWLFGFIIRYESIILIAQHIWKCYGQIHQFILITRFVVSSVFFFWLFARLLD